MVKKPPASAGDVRDVSSIPGSGSSPGGGCGNLQQYCCLENPMGCKELDMPEVTGQAHMEAPRGLRMEQNMGQHGEPGRQVSAKAAFCDPDTDHHIWNENFRAKRTNGKKRLE